MSHDLFILLPSSNCRNQRGREMLNLVQNLLEITPTISSVRLSIIFFLGWKNYLRWRITRRKKKYPADNWKILFQGDRRPFVIETVKADDAAKMGNSSICSMFLDLVSRFSFTILSQMLLINIFNFWSSGKGPSQPAPKFVGNLIAYILNLVIILHAGLLGYIVKTKF